MEPITIYGKSGAGPLEIDAYDEEPGWVTVRWPDGGLFLDAAGVRQLVRALQDASAASQGS